MTILTMVCRYFGTEERLIFKKKKQKKGGKNVDSGKLN